MQQLSGTGNTAIYCHDDRGQQNNSINMNVPSLISCWCLNESFLDLLSVHPLGKILMHGDGERRSGKWVWFPKWLPHHVLFFLVIYWRGSCYWEGGCFDLNDTGSLWHSTELIHPPSLHFIHLKWAVVKLFFYNCQGQFLFICIISTFSDWMRELLCWTLYGKNL